MKIQGLTNLAADYLIDFDGRSQNLLLRSLWIQGIRETLDQIVLREPERTLSDYVSPGIQEPNWHRICQRNSQLPRIRDIACRLYP